MERNDYNPDVLNCLANLSNDEVFTPPALANRMLDLLPQELFQSPQTTFLDPFTKSGVFLREIVKRLDRGLQQQIPDRRQRIDHILHHQVYGIAITELTAYLSRRTLYCSKKADSRYSVTQFDTPEGNIQYRPLRHTFGTNGKCIYCNASQSVYDRDNAAEQYAYQFIHTDNPKNIFPHMKFDVIIGNPPYQMNDGGGGSTDAAMPIYNKFVEQSKKLDPHYLIMIIPSKWMVGGRNLTKFRDDMLSDRHIRVLFDYEDASQCFSGTHIDGGVCYFMWDSSYLGKVNYTFNSNNGEKTTSVRNLYNTYFDFIIRDGRILSILEKIGAGNKFKNIVSSTKPYGIRGSLFNEPERYPELQLSEVRKNGQIKIYGVKGLKGGARRQIGYVNLKAVPDGKDSIDLYKIFFTTSYSTNATIPPAFIDGNTGEICTETFLMIGPFKTKEERDFCKTYMQTNFFLFLLYHGHGSVRVTKDVFGLIPLVDFTHPWTDEMLYKKYNLTQSEIDFIESMIRPME